MITLPEDYPSDVPPELNVVTYRVWRNQAVSVGVPVPREIPDVVIGLDPGLASTGVAAVRRAHQRYAVVGTMHLRTAPHKHLLKSIDIGARCRAIARMVAQFVAYQGWDAVHLCAEAWSFRAGQKVTLEATATPRIIGTTEGYLLADMPDVETSEIPTTTIKKRVGVGPSRHGDPKKRVRAATERLTGFQAKNEHERDAIAAAIAGWAEVGG